MAENTLIRFGLEVDASRVVAGTTQAKNAFNQLAASAPQAAKRTAASMEEAAFAADRLNDRFVALTQQAKLGLVTKAQYAAGLRALQVEMRALAASGTLSTESIARLTQTAKIAEAALLRTSGVAFRYASGATRAAFALNGLAMAAGSGMGKLQALSAAMLTMSVGRPELMAAVAGIALLATTLSAMRGRADEAASAMDRLVRAARGVGVTDVASSRANLDAIERAQSRAQTVPDLTRPGETITLTTKEYFYNGRWHSEAQWRQDIANAQAVYGSFLDASSGREPRGVAGTQSAVIGVGRRPDSKSRKYGAALAGTPEVFNPEPIEDRFKLVTGPLEEVATKAGAAEEAMAKLTDQTSEWAEIGAEMGQMFQHAFGYAMQAIIFGGEGAGRALKNVMKALAGEAAVKAIFQVAEGLAAFARGDTKAGSGHMAAAAKYGAAAAAAGVVASGVGGGGGGGASASSSGQGGGGVAIIELGSRRYDPRDVDELAALLERVGNRRVIVRRV